MDILGSILTGIVAGVIASIVFYFFVYKIKPKILVADKACIRDQGNDIILTVKVVNKTKSMLTNIKYSLYIETEYPDHIIEAREIEPCKSRLSVIDKYNKKDENAGYAVRLSYKIDPETLQEENVYLSFVIYGNHNISNTSSYVKKRYQIEDVVRGEFETKTSLNVLQPNSRKK